jgi:PleD family two-component response regulator
LRCIVSTTAGSGICCKTWRRRIVIAIPAQLPDETISWISDIQDGLRRQAKRASDFPEGILISAGILYCASGVKLIFEDVIQELDKLLYEAKVRARNCFVIKEISE